MKIGYARVSTTEQKLDLQEQALTAEGCDAIICDKASGKNAHRPGLKRAIGRCGAGDTLVVWKLDRLGRSLIDLVNIVRKLERRGANLKVLTGQGASIDTTKPEGRMIFGIFATIAEFERELIRERTIAGMEAARRRGVHVGRPRKLTDRQIEKARKWIEDETASCAEAAARLGVDPATLRRAVANAKRAEAA